MSLLYFLLIGLIAGFIAEKATSSNHGLLTNLIVGAVGALLGGWLAGLFNLTANNFIGSLILATVGAIILIMVLRMVRR